MNAAPPSSSTRGQFLDRHRVRDELETRIARLPNPKIGSSTRRWSRETSNDSTPAVALRLRYEPEPAASDEAERRRAPRLRVHLLDGQTFAESPQELVHVERERPHDPAMEASIRSSSSGKSTTGTPASFGRPARSHSSTEAIARWWPSVM